MAKKQIKKYVFEPGISKDASLYPKAVALLLANKAFLQAQVVAFINYNITNNIAPYVGYTFASAKCTRDVGYFIDAVAHDLRYGGNVNSRQIAEYFWIDGEPMIRGDVAPETTGQAYLASVINDYIFTNTTVTPSYSNASVQTKYIGQNAEAGASSRNTSLWNIFTTVITNGVDAVPAKIPGVSSIKLLGNYNSSELLLITDTVRNQILYNFADPAFPVTIVQKQGRSSGDGKLLSDLDFPTWWQTSDAITTLYLAKDTSVMSATDDIQIFVESESQTIRPWDFGTDAIERMRVAAPQAMLDADFEYGLQPTKWQAIGLMRGYPSLFEIPGTDLTVTAMITDASVNTGNFGSSLITVTTSGSHGFTIQQPITVKGLNAAIPGFARAEGSFLIYSIPNSVTFTYYASARVGASEGQSLFTSFVQIRQAGFYTGASIGQPTFSVFSNGSTQSISTQFSTPSGSFNIAFNGTSPTPGSPISGSPNLAAATSVSGVVGASTVTANAKFTTLSTDTSLSLVDLTGVQQAMAIDNGSGDAIFINSLSGNLLNLSGPCGQIYIGANATNTAVSGTNINGIGTNATFDVSRSGGVYTVTDTFDSSSNGENYAAGDAVIILGSALGGTNGVNDVIISVTSVDSGGAITNFSYTGTAISGGATYNNQNSSSTTSIAGGGAQLSVARTGGTGTYAIALSAGGADYLAGDTVTWAGTLFGGTSPANDIVIQVDGVTAGAIVDYQIVGTPVGASGDASYPAETAANIPVAGSSATFTIIRTDGVYSVVNPLAVPTGSGYAVGNRILISGTSLDGAAGVNDCTVQVASVSPPGALIPGQILSVTTTGTPFAGDDVVVYPTLSISEATTGIIGSGTVLNAGAIATVQVDFATNHGLIPGTTILTSISSQPAPDFTATARTLPGSGSWSGVAFAGSTFVAVLPSTQTSARSIDGNNWANGGNLPSAATWTSVAAGVVASTTYFVAVASGGTAAAYSTNAGVSWSAATLPASATWSSVAYYGGCFVAVASGGTAAAYSTDGQTWATATLPASATWTDVAGGLIGSSTYFVAISSGGTAAAYSVDNGASWLATGALPASTTWTSLAYGNSRFFAVASGGTIGAFSTNGNTWTASVLPTSANWNSVTFGDDSFVAVASGSTSALTSFTGETGSFTAQTTTSAANWEEIAFGSYTGLGKFAVVGNSNSAMDIVLTSANHQIATGPHVVTQVPSLTSIRYPSRTTGAINTTVASLTGSVYARPDSFFTHRPFDGGVQLGTGNPSHGAQAIRQSKKYIRYQSGKGMMYTTGGLFAPSYNISSATAVSPEVNSFITFTCDDTDHGLQPGAEIEIIGCVSFEYNGDYVVESIVDARSFRVRSNAYLSTLSAQLGTDCKVLLKRWTGATVRIGAFDEQNGIFYQYDGREMAVVRRSSTNQLSGTTSISVDSNLVTGSGTRFQEQLKVGDKIVIRGMSHIVSGITSQTSMTMTPDWRGANSVTGARICITEELYIPQSEWNVDTFDGNGPSGYDLLPWRMQMLGMQYTWYAAGFIEFMMRGADGKFVFLHRIRNSNTNTEAYMRTANLPVRYEVENRSAVNKLALALGNGDNSLTLTDGHRFPSSGIVYIDNEVISYSGKSGRTLTGLSRAASFTAFTAGQNRTFTGGVTASHSAGAGVSLISCTCSPTISHWGSALLTDGLFDTDRGYLFNYAVTGLSITTTRQTAFMLRLAPSVSNAIVGDLGERDLLNRAQLLLNAITLTADTGSGAIVVEGVLNPRNYPASPSNVTFTGLASAAAGGQPSFAQIALGGSINWGGVPSSTTTATVQGALTTTISARGFATVTQSVTAIALPTGIDISGLAVSSARTDFYILNSAYDLITATPLRVGDGVFLTSRITGGQTIASITRAYLGTAYTRIQMTAVANTSSPVNVNQTITITSSISVSYARAYSAGRTDFLITNADATASNVLAGDSLSATTYVIGGQTVSSVTSSYATVAGTAYTRIIMNTGANATIGPNTNVSTTVTASGTTASYSGTNFLFFTNATWNSSGASVSTRVATSFTQFAAGTSVSAVTTRRLGATTVIRASFTQNLNTPVAAAATVTFQFGDPQFALPGEQVFSFVANPGNTTSLDLLELKELTTTAIGGRGAFPNGPDVLAINVYKVSGTATPASIILRWGEAQA